MVKYKDYFNKMVEDHKEVFDAFKKLHNEYYLNQESLQEKFNKEGEKILGIIREYENRLCANTERGVYNKFSAGLAQKFQDEVRKNFPMIDHIGLKIDKKQNVDPPDIFSIKKIRLS